MKDWEKRNAEEMVEGLVGLDLAGIEKTLGELSEKSLSDLGRYLAKRYPKAGKSFAGILHGLCIIEAGQRVLKGGGDE